MAETTLALLRAELRLARRSAVTLIGLAIALVFLATAVWLHSTPPSSSAFSS
ncbi:MAG: hypothetical protein IPQ17_07205 [Xanthomonadales bacterium]|nr:hypothetical protein [Xanthomonadales bacterium]